MCAVATTGECGSMIITPPMKSSFHNPNVRAVPKRLLYSSTKASGVAGKKSSAIWRRVFSAQP
jgi:hypothetical protein